MSLGRSPGAPMRVLGAGRGFGPGRIGMPGEKPRDFGRTLRRLVAYFRPYWLALSVACLATVGGTAASIEAPKLMGEIATDLFKSLMARPKGGSGADLASVVHLLALLGVLYGVSALLSYVQQSVMAVVSQRAVFELRRRASEKIARLPIRYFDSHPHGEVLSRFVNDFDNIGSTLQQSLTQLLQAVVTFVGVTVMMLSISPLMTAAVVVTLPLSFLITREVATRSQRHFAMRQRLLGELNGHVEEMYTGHQVVKAFGQEGRAIATFAELNARLRESTWKAQFISGLIMPLMNFVGNIGYVLVSVLGGVLVVRGQIQIGDILAFIQYARQFTQPITQLSSISNTIQSTMASAERVFEILDEPEEPADAPDAGVIEHPEGAVRFSRVSFRYEEDRPLIEDLDIDVRPGQTIAIVGPTGAGKTTLVNLLMRFYDLRQGRITVDGQDIATLRRGPMRRLFGMVLQDTWLFHGTIRDNIAYGLPSADDRAIVAAAKTAQADHFIRTLPEGYGTVIDEEAANLSQGQKQLLTIARAVLADPPILILDEATSSVDTRTEALIQQAMRQLMRGRTSFVIAHRLSTVRDADLILVMDHGRIVERGTHEELLRQGGLYAELYRSQFQHQEVTREVV